MGIRTSHPRTTAALHITSVLHDRTAGSSGGGHKSSAAIETALALAKDRGAPRYFVVNSVRIQG